MSLAQAKEKESKKVSGKPPSKKSKAVKRSSSINGNSKSAAHFDDWATFCCPNCGVTLDVISGKS